MAVPASRPLYGEFAWAYDALFPDDPTARAAFVAETLSARGVGLGAAVIEAGCLTGRYSRALASLGFRVTGVDPAPEMIALAGRSPSSATFVRRDLPQSSPRPVDAILCRGVINDFADPDDRQAVCTAFAHWLRTAGILILEARDHEVMAVRWKQPQRYESHAMVEGVQVDYACDIRMSVDGSARLREVVAVARGADLRTAEHEYVMRAWSAAELRERLLVAGFAKVDRVRTDAFARDRLVVVATR